MMIPLTAATLGLAWQDRQLTRAAVEARHAAKVTAIATTVALGIDGDLHEALHEQRPQRDAFRSWKQAPSQARELASKLRTAHLANGLSTPMYTLSLTDPERTRAQRQRAHDDGTRFLFTSAEVPYWLHEFSYLPRMGGAFFDGQVVTTPIYQTHRGWWLSAYAPIRTSDDRIVAILEVDARLDDLLEAADSEWQSRLLTHLLGALVLTGLLLGATRLVLAPLKQLASAADRFDRDASTLRISGPWEVEHLSEVLEQTRVRMMAGVTELVEARDRLRSEVHIRKLAETSAKIASRAKSRFLANMSHELRTPLNAIVGYAELLSEEAEEMDGEQLQLDLDRIQGAARSLLTMIDDILDLTRIETGALELMPEPFDLAEVVETIFAQLKPHAESRNNDLLADIDPDLGPLNLDPHRTRQILANLISNAVKFTEDGTIRVHARSVAGGVVIQVADDGIGIPIEKQVRIFQPFAQADDSATRAYDGIGLGLAICAELCRLQGGKIEVASELGAGSTFTVHLPRS